MGRWFGRQERSLYKHGDPSLDSQHPHEKKPGMAAHTYGPENWGWEEREVKVDGSWELAGLAGSVRDSAPRK